jgi:putative endonuclease
VNTVEKGRAGEDKAAGFLEDAGMRILARNYRSAYGEIDIVAMDHGVLVFVEVKAWKTMSFADIEYSIDKKKQRKIIQTAKFFLSNNREYSDTGIRFDVLFIGRDTVRHLASAFMESV